MSPLLVLLTLTSGSARGTIRRDVRRWAEILGYPRLPDVWTMLLLLARHQEYRNLYYYRISTDSVLARIPIHVFKLFYPELPTLRISARGAIGPGLFIQHGFSTIVAADTIGTNCWINQQVTIGYTNKTDCPTIGDHVRVTAGAKVLGAIRLGDHVTVGANAVVVKDVPADCVVVGVPARIVRRNGVRVDDPLQ
jgi:serine O-acetyltransferase